MGNYFKDTPDIRFNLERVGLKALADLMENDYSDVKTFDFAPENADEAVENYFDICDLAGELCAGPIAERARQIDREGNTVSDGKVTYHKLVQNNLRDFQRAQLMGISLPRAYGGLNMPQVVKIAVLEMVSRADASLMNLVGLQDIGETINEFGTNDQKRQFITGLASGDATGAMILTEPDSGSDLQSVRLAAIPPRPGEDPNVWHLNGVKRFITNGNGDTLLVLARSEEGTRDGRGLSMFVCSRDETIYIRRLENKLGIHGSPTCDMTFNNTPAYLVGQRKRGLIKYVMSLMNGARMGVSAQAIGIAEAAYKEAHEYAEKRIQFGKPIIKFPAVYDMLTDMRLKIEAGRLLLYEAGRIVDMFKIPTAHMETAKEKGEAVDLEMKKQIKMYERLASVLTPLSKYYNSEMSNEVAYKGIQIMGGSGFMKDYNMERYYRDARITNIYEGTSQLQVIGALSGILSGVMDKIFQDFVEYEFPRRLNPVVRVAKDMVPLLYETIAFVKEKKNSEYTDYVAKRIVDMCLDIYQSILFLECAEINERKEHIAVVWVREANLRVSFNHKFILEDRHDVIDLHKEILD
ncbi:MAG TPA: acyl-CoA dehydrogenase [Candidatus Marinimicrobia bacterium]|nr:acyl-CoA dehydrogenase [Candidatus Neomarinimicrobiota bacterium]